MSEQNNNCEQCGNNKEPNGECYECDTRECGICYERRRWSFDGGVFNVGVNCDHLVCVWCSERITRCPFCRKRWTEYEDSDDDSLPTLHHEDVEEEEAVEGDDEPTDEEPPCDRCGNPSTAGLINDEFLCIDCRENDE